MAQFASDPFTGTAGVELSAYNPLWVRHSASTTSVDARITNANRVRGIGGFSGTAIYYHTGTPASSDYSVSSDVFEASDATYAAGVIARCDPTAHTMYMARWAGFANPDVVQLYKFVAGTPTQLGTDVTADFTTGTTRSIKLECIGSSIKVYIDGSSTPSISVTDSSITAAGKAGIRLGYSGAAVGSDSTTLHLTNFSADDIGGGSPAFGKVNVGGAWKSVTSVSVKVGGVWKSVSAIQVNVSGTWKALV